MTKRFFVFCVLLYTINYVLCHKCIHDQISPPEHIKNLPTVRGIVHSDKKRAPPEPIRIVFNTDTLTNDPDRLCTSVGQWAMTGDAGEFSDSTKCASGECLGCDNCWFQCTADDVLTPAKLNFLLNEIIPDAKNHFAQSLSVDRVVGNLSLQGATNCKCSGKPGAPIPNEYQTTGVADADMIIFITARTTRFTGSTAAFACSCLDDFTTRRPIAGYVNWGPNSIDLDEISYKEQLGIGIHELTHALGFGPGKYAYYGGHVNGDGNNTAVVNYNEDGMTHTVVLLTTPKVIEVARQHFNCPTLQGVELENGGSNGTASSHWERRVLYNEYMTGSTNYEPFFSQFTLALLEDSGWYYPNYTAAQLLLWGKDQGCDFVTKRCNNRKGSYFCMKDSESCSFDGKKKGRCNVRSGYSLPDWYTYYSDSSLGGTDSLADYCGFIDYRQQYRGDCTIDAYNSPGDDSFNINNFGEHYCANCRCITALENQTPGPSCHNLTCVTDSNNHTMIKLKIGYIWYDCQDGQSISVTEGFEGTYQCPSSSLCTSIPSDTGNWPSLTSVSPTEGKLGDIITISGENFGNDPTVLFGLYYGCVTPTISGNTITCEIGKRDNAPTLRGKHTIDVVVVDQQTGHTAYKAKAFELSNSLVNLPSLLFLSSFLLYLICL